MTMDLWPVPVLARLGLAAVLSAGMALVLGPVVIPWLERLRFGQTVREQGPARHRVKQGTPTMGGVIFLVPALLVTGWLAPPTPATLLVLGVTLAFGAVGLVDDYLKVALRRSLGLRARAKLFWQVVGAALLVYLAQVWLGRGTAVWVPFGAGWWDLGAWYYPLAVLAVVASANAVNETDGLDGLAAGSTLIALSVFFYAAARSGRYDLAIFIVSLGAALAGFLWFNLHPARVFMGDTGSLALGAALGGLAVLTGTELVLPVAGMLFVLETLSVIVQVASFRLTGRRILRMSPLHHHFELSGWTEAQVVYRFWAAGLGFALAGFLALGGFPG
ncbi:phospho-N-acetylmuramoyl-pentapeptide-transferase [Thermaerobacter subterraneus]|uniref:Phospho-N-acetylmuramoyl-pentapeptide-transferase n=1 Tax=Thermaerobacter subterraneus DSM 13965 TaxID=867903 RepID=K6QFR4_9FIRM|nr:phospho-N-acetylmuramoyl-pentapeptide-transferase [Thermaerobacter subterraneus]EKP95901.1 Phospho-N-acetylmuramoyl-pentapeptide-transferase [Thermaerobacter subterraneus DSM 13965]